MQRYDTTIKQMSKVPPVPIIKGISISNEEFMTFSEVFKKGNIILSSLFLAFRQPHLMTSHVSLQTLKLKLRL